MQDLQRTGLFYKRQDTLNLSLVTPAQAKLPATYENAKRALEQCADIDECQEWANKAEALASYARMADDETLMKMATRIKANAIRRAGELLKQVDGRGDHMKKEGDRLSQTSIASSAGMSPHQSKQAVRLANVPAEDFDRQVEGDNPPTVTSLAEQGTQKRDFAYQEKPEGYAQATQLLGTVREFADFCSKNSPEKIASAIFAHEAGKARVHVSKIDSWLDRFVVNLKD